MKNDIKYKDKSISYSSLKKSVDGIEEMKEKLSMLGEYGIKGFEKYKKSYWSCLYKFAGNTMGRQDYIYWIDRHGELHRGKLKTIRYKHDTNINLTVKEDNGSVCGLSFYSALV